MIHQLPLARKDLINLYNTIDNGSADEKINHLDPAVCAGLRDPLCFMNSPFNTFHKVGIEKNIFIGGKHLKWIMPKQPQELLLAAGLSTASLKGPCEKRIHFIENKMQSLTNLYQNEIDFIHEFTSYLCWFETQDQLIGNAAFYEIPHCTFFSDYAMFSIPPEIIVPEAHAEYGILENLYHEALHHQMHAFSALATKGYLSPIAHYIPEIALTWRDRKFTLLEAIHALHIYSLITPLRLHYLTNITHNTNTAWLLKAYQDGLRMWKDLAEILLNHLHYFKNPWPEFITAWHKKYKIFIT